MKQLHPVFNVVKLTPALDDPITGCKTEDYPPPIVIDGEAEWEVEEILDSHWHQRRFQYLIKWKGYGCKHNSWESASEVFAPELTAEFHRKHPGDGDQREFDLETRVTTNGNRIISEMLHSCALNK